MLAALADGRSELHGLAPGADCRATRQCLAGLGVQLTASTGIATGGDVLFVEGRGLGGLTPAPEPLDAMNSGTTTRLLAGILAAHPFSTTLTGDESLSRRPMRRVIDPLQRMGARIESSRGCLPLTVHGGPLKGITFTPEVPSAQIKSAVLLAGLHADGCTTLREPSATRNHTELALRGFGVDVQVASSGDVTLHGGQRLHPCRARVPGDPSSAAFWAVAAAGLRGSDIEIRDVGLNPTRLAFIEVLRRAGALVDLESGTSDGLEPAGTIRVRHAALREIAVDPAEVPALIDELPALAALATFGGAMTVHGAAELRVKESDRISALVAGLRSLGASADEFPDGFAIDGSRPLRGGVADACGDHRLAMAFAVAALGARGRSAILGADAVAVSYPGFFQTLESIRT